MGIINIIEQFSNIFISFLAEVELESIQERYIQVLRTYLQHSSPQNPQARLNELLSHIPEVRKFHNLHNFLNLSNFS